MSNQHKIYKFANSINLQSQQSFERIFYHKIAFNSKLFYSVYVWERKLTNKFHNVKIRKREDEKI